MAKTSEQKRKDQIEAAIRSLYQLFPMTGFRHGCHSVRTRETCILDRKINKREKELELKIKEDAELKQLRKELAAEKKRVHAILKDAHREIDAILRQYQLRGESEELLNRIEKMAAKEPIHMIDDYENCE